MSAILAVIIGVVFVYSLISILVTQINSVIANMLRLRARHLRDGLDDLVTDPVLQAKVFSHPLIQLVKNQMVLPTQRLTNDEAREIAQSDVNDVTWIKPETFVQVLMNVIRVDADQELFGALLNVIDGMPAGADRRRLRLIVNRIMTTGDGLDELRTTIANLEEAVYRDALMQTLDQIDDEIGKMGLEPNSIISVMAGLRQVNNPYFRTALQTILSTAQNMEQATEQLVDWFDEGMNRATRTFTQTMQKLSLLMGLVIAVFVNVDSLQLARSLWEDPALRDSVAAVAQQAVEAGTLEASMNASTSVSGTVSAQGVNLGLGDIAQEITDDFVVAQTTVNELISLNLPIGWTYENLSELDADDELLELKMGHSNNIWNLLPWNNANWLGLVLSKVVGLILTMIAVSQGAPFWFNILRRLMGGNPASD